jgi:Flp pilus assembly protein TadG
MIPTSISMYAAAASAMIELALAAAAYMLMLVGIMEGGRLGFAYNSISYAAHRAARFAAVRGSTSGHAASQADVRAEALGQVAALDTANLTVTATWTPDNHPGSTVGVTVSYRFSTVLVPLSSGLMTLATTSRQVIAQ